MKRLLYFLLLPLLLISSPAATILEYSGDGVTIKFNPNGTRAGINVGSHTADPSSLANGDLWYNSTSNALKARINGATVSLGSGGGGSSAFGDLTGDPYDNALLSAELDAKQELDSDLTAIAGLNTTSFGRGLLDDADAAAARITLNLGSMALQPASGVTITGGTVSALTAPLSIGAGTAGALSGNPGITLNRTVSTTAHGFSDESSYIVGTTESFNSFDAIPQITGRTSGGASVHYSGLQIRGKLLSGTLTDYYGFFVAPEVGATATIQTLRMLYAAPPVITAGGAITTAYGLQIGNLAQTGVTNPVSIASDYNIGGWHLGSFAFGKGIYADSSSQVESIPTANKRGLYISGYSVTGSNTTPALDIAGTWNTSGTATGIKLNITNTASHADSRPLDLQMSDSSIFWVDRSGSATSYTHKILADVGQSDGTIIAAGNDAGTNTVYLPSQDGDLALIADISSYAQPLDADLTDLADGSLTGSKVGSGIAAGNITTGTVGTARLGSGTANSSTFLRGDGAWAAPSGSGDAVLSANQTWTGQNIFSLSPRISRTDLAAGTALTVGTHYWVALSAIRTLTFSGSPSDGDEISLAATVSSGPIVLTVPTSYRVGTSSTTTTISLPTGNHLIRWTRINSTWVMADSGVDAEATHTVLGNPTGGSLAPVFTASPVVTSIGVDTETYDTTGWNSDLTVPTKDALRDQLIIGDTDGDGKIDVLDVISAAGFGAFSSGGVPVQGRTLTGTTNQIAVTNGTGASGDPVFSLVSSAILPGSPTVATPGTGAGSVATTDGTQPLTNKRITARVTSITSSATPTVNTDNCDCVTITALAAAITSMTTNLSGTPANFDQLEFRIKDDGTARAITWGSSFVSGPTELPTTTTISKALHVWLEWDSVQSKWVCMAAGSDA